MNVLEELHRLVDGLDDYDCKQQFHALVNELDEEAARRVIWRMRRSHRCAFDEWGFTL
jgi:hypothetical protein